MGGKDEKRETCVPGEWAVFPLAGITGVPPNLSNVPLSVTAPEGLAIVRTMPNAAEADLTRQLLAVAGFHVEFVPSATGIFGATGSVHVYVRAGEEEEAREFLRGMEAPGNEAGGGGAANA